MFLFELTDCQFGFAHEVFDVRFNLAGKAELGIAQL